MTAGLKTQRRQTAARIDQLEAPARALELEREKLEDLDQQIADQQRLEQEAQRVAQQRASQIATLLGRYNSNQDLNSACRDIHAARLALVELGIPDPGNRLISAEAIGAPLIERDRSI